MFPASWFKKLFKNVIGNTKNSSPIKNNETINATSLPSVLQQHGHRKSYYITRDLNNPEQPPRKSSSRRRRRRRIFRPSQPFSTSNCRTTQEYPPDHHHHPPPLIITNKPSSPTGVKAAASSSTRVRLRPNSPRIRQRRGVAVVKSSQDPRRDFRESMVEMIVENDLRAGKELEELLACYLSLNSYEYHHLIINVFSQIWFDFALH